MRNKSAGSRAERLRSGRIHERRIEMKLRTRVQLYHFLQQLRFQWRRGWLQQQAQALAPRANARLQLCRSKLRSECAPGRRRAATADALRAMRVVELEDGRLLKNPGGSDLRRPSVVTLDQDSRNVSIDYHRCRVMARDARGELQLIHVRQDFFYWLACAAAESSECHARAQELHEISARKIVITDETEVGLQRCATIVVHLSITDDRPCKSSRNARDISPPALVARSADRAWVASPLSLFPRPAARIAPVHDDTGGTNPL